MREDAGRYIGELAVVLLLLAGTAMIATGLAGMWREQSHQDVVCQPSELRAVLDCLLNWRTLAEQLQAERIKQAARLERLRPLVRAAVTVEASRDRLGVHGRTAWFNRVENAEWDGVEMLALSALRDALTPDLRAWATGDEGDR